MSNERPQSKGRIRAARMLIDMGAGRYDRNRHLDRLLGGYADPWSASASDSTATIARLKRALRSQRRLGRVGHWSYDLNRHLGLLQALKAEITCSRSHTTAAAGEKAGASAASGNSETGSETS